MKFIENRTTYTELNSLLESRLYFSNDLRNKLEKIGDEVSKELLNLEFNDSGESLSFIDIDQKNDKLFSFSRMDKLDDKGFKFFGVGIEDMEEPHIKSFWDAKSQGLINDDFKKEFDKSRSNIKIGKFINKILLNKFSDSQIETFVNSMKALNSDKGNKFEIVDGEKIIDYYLCDVEDGNLGNSCMQGEKRVNRDFFNLYSENKSCQLLVLLDKDNNLLGRALIWKTTDEFDGGKFDYYMDQIYPVHDKYYHTFKNHAEENGWAIRAKTGVANSTDIIYDGNYYNNQRMSVNIEVIPERFPYMDTFKVLDIDKKKLYNFDTDNSEHLWLEETDGSADTSRIQVDLGRRKGEYHIVNDVVTTKNGWVHKDDVVKLKSGYRIITK
jgi:hypothetical protein